MPSFKSVAVIGAGAWGTALAGVAARAGRDVILFARNAESAAAIAATRQNPKLSGAPLDASVSVTSDVALAARADIIVIATPIGRLRSHAPGLWPPDARNAQGYGRHHVRLQGPSSGPVTGQSGKPL